MCCSCLNRRDFLGMSPAVILGTNKAFAAMAGSEREVEWDPHKPFSLTGSGITVQPVLMYKISERKKQTSWKSWGGVQSEQTASEESKRITTELDSMADSAEFPLKINPVVKVRTPEEVSKIHIMDYDILVVYAASGGGNLFEACISGGKDTIVFVRHSSGPAYYWYEGLSVKYLKTNANEANQNSAVTTGNISVDDVVVDDYEEVLWKLRALYGLKNFINSRIVALGGPWGKYAPEAPDYAQKEYNMKIIGTTYDDLAIRIQKVMTNRNIRSKAEQWANTYLSLPGTKLSTEKQFVTNSFLLYWVFKKLMQEYNAPAFTIKNCMNTIMPMSETTACLTLSLLNDEGLLAFCESDFVIIPSGILLHYITGKPVFLHNSTFPHKGMVTCAHCTSPRRLDGINYEQTIITTHYESEYGAAPKVDMPIGQEVTFINPEYSSGRWVGFKGNVKSNPFYEICRSQQDVTIQGNWKKLINEVRDSHWVMAYGDYLKEINYAAKKLNITFDNISET